MQKKFIGEIEKQSYEQIDVNKDKMKVLGIENDTHIEHNELIESNIQDIVKDQEEVTDACNKLVKLNNLKGKISQKVASITKEHKFFTQNTVCPTCDLFFGVVFRFFCLAVVLAIAGVLFVGFLGLVVRVVPVPVRVRRFAPFSLVLSLLLCVFSPFAACLCVFLSLFCGLAVVVLSLSVRLPSCRPVLVVLAGFFPCLLLTVGA
jgi:hypothetical protein